MRQWWRWAGLAALAGLMALVLGACAGGSSSGIVIPTATAGQLRLSTDRATYSVSQPIGITVSNTSGNNYYALTGHSACTFLQMQRYDSAHKQWNDVNACGDGAPAQVLLIRGHMSEPLSLAPGATPSANTWQPGTYRIALSYSAKSDGTSDPQVAYSQGFTIARS
ncbi:MAG TPA: hypothetical protein VFY89_03880 [Ktedonobacterales bacterium]